MKFSLAFWFASISSLAPILSAEKIDADGGAKCVTLLKHTDMMSCSGKAEKVKFTVSNKPGSNQYCYHDNSMYSMLWIPYSVNDQYCNDEFYHQLLYFGSDDCVDDSWWVHPTPQIFTKTDCLYGFKFKACETGPCEDKKASNEEHSNITTMD